MTGGPRRDTYSLSIAQEEGVAVACAFCVIDRKRISSSKQLFQRTHPLPRTPGGRVGSLPARALHRARKGREWDGGYDTWHSAPNHMEPPSSAAPCPGSRDAANPRGGSVQGMICVAVPRANGTRCLILPLILPRTRTDGVHRFACVLLEGHGSLGGYMITRYSSPSGGTREQQVACGRLPNCCSGCVGARRQRFTASLGLQLGNLGRTGDLRVYEDMSLLAHYSRTGDITLPRIPAPPMREAPIVGREPAIALRHYADLSSFPV